MATPNFEGALYPQWPQVTPYALNSGSQFRPNGVPALNSAEYAAAYNETLSLGARDSSTRTAEQTQIAQFWSDGSGTYSPAGHWNEIAQTAASIQGTSLIESARLFALLDVALADAGIAAWDAKYTYNTWRPITAIRSGDLDGNAATTVDANWQPLLSTPPFPEYVSGHSTFSAAAAAVLGGTFGDNFQFQSGTVTLPGVSRTFNSFTEAAAEAGQSRIYGGIHFQFSNWDGQNLGRQVGQYVFNRFMLDETQGAIQVKLTQDTAAFGATNRDRVTNIAGLSGAIRLNQAGLRLEIAQGAGAFVDITSAVQADRTFQLSAVDLAGAIGVLTDKRYQLTLRLVDGTGAVVGSNNFNFTLDTTAPTVQLGDLTGASPLAHLSGTSEGGGGGRFRLDNGNWTNFAVNPDGSFDSIINPQGLTAGAHRVEVEIADAANNIATQLVDFAVDGTANFFASPATNGGWGQTLSNGFALYEGRSFVTEKAIDVVLGGIGKRTLEFDLKANFDGSDTRSFARDRVAIYLVDANGVALSIGGNRPGSLPVFALNESGSEIVPGLVQFDGTHVKIDVSGVNATAGRLVVQLLNQDGDGRSNVKVTNFVDRLDSQSISGTAVSPYVAPVAPGAAVVLDGYLGTTNGQLMLSEVSFDRTTGKYYAELRVKNIGTGNLSRNLAVLLTDLPAGVTVGNGSGTHPAGSTYLNFAPAIQPGGLGAGEISGAIRLEINDPTLATFSFKPVVLQGAAEPIPDLTALRNLTVKVGEKLDFALDPNLTFAISATGNLPTGSITGDRHLIFKPAPNQIGTYNFTLVARNGSVETRQEVTLNVVPDEVVTTRVTGVIANTNQAPISGVLVELAGQQATTDGAGRFEIVIPAGAAGDTLKIYGQRIQGGGITYPFIAEKMDLLLGHDVYQGVNNGIDRPIYLPTIDVTSGIAVNPNSNTVVTNPNLVGSKVTVNANSLFDKNGNAFQGTLTITEVPPSLTPAALPDNLRPDLIVTIQPGDMVFNVPAPLTLANRAGYAAGTDMDLWSINPNTGAFEKVGLGRVSADGSVVETIEGGIRNSSWHFFVPPAPPVEPDPPKCKECDEAGAPFNSEVSLKTGGVTETHNLFSYQSLGENQGLTLTYDSLRADARAIVNIRFPGLPSGFQNIPELYLTAGLSITGNNNFAYELPGAAAERGLSGGEHFWRLSGQNSSITTSLLVDLREQQSGRFDFQSKSGFRRYVNVLNRFTGTSSTNTGKLIHINSVNSNFGAGWGINGVQTLVENADKSVLLIDGNGGESIFEAPTQPGGTYQSAPSNFSTLVKLANGRFQLTTKNRTVSTFDEKNRLVSVKSANGQETKHIYNALGQLTEVIDPAGLATVLAYGSNGKVSSITDPNSRRTLMEYDGRGNLVKITNPDGTARTFGYDNDHHMTSEINQRSGQESSFYDPLSGRAIRSIRPDGSEIRLVAQDTVGLFDPRLTSNPFTAPDAASAVKATYTDSNGNSSQYVLNSVGERESSQDGEGRLGSVVRNGRNQVIAEIDALGNKTRYFYDNQGNVIRKVEETGTSRSIINVSPVITNTNVADFLNVANTKVDDVNRDGYLDAVVWKNNSVSVWLGDASGGFTNSQTYQLDGLAVKGELQDLNSDNKLDLITVEAGAESKVVIRLGDGNGVFTQSNSYTFFNLYGFDVPVLNSFAMADINNDGFKDLFYRSIYGFNLRLGRGNGEFGATLYRSVDWGNNGGGSARSSGASINSVIGEISATDLDGDGDVDWVVPTGAAVKKITNNGFNNYVPSDIISGGGYGSGFDPDPGVVLADFNGDNKIDILKWNKGVPTATVLLNSGNGNFSFGSDITIGSGNSLVLADFNNDQIDDLIVGGEAGSGVVTVSLGRGNGSFDSLITLTGFEPSATVTAVADFDGDGLNDILTTHNQGMSVHSKLQAATSTAVTSYTYDSVYNYLTSETDALGRKTIYGVDAATGNRTSVTRVVGLVDTESSETDDVTVSYTYTASGLIDTETDALGRVTNHDYDGQGNLIRMVQAQGTADEAVTLYEYDLLGNQTAAIDPLGRRTEYIYNAMNLLVRTIQPDPDGAGALTSPTTDYGYDQVGNRIWVRDARGNTTRYEYDQMGRMITMIGADPDGVGAQVNAVTRYEYDLAGNQVAVIDPLGRRTTSIYDVRDRLVETIDANGGRRGMVYDTENRLVSSIDANGNRRSTIYDAQGRVVREVDALGQFVETEYDAASQIIESKDQLGRTTRYQYDDLGRQIAVTNALGQVTRTGYDKVGNVTVAIDAKGNRTEYRYDALNRRIEVKDALGGISRSVYDQAGRIVTAIDPLNRTTTFGYDALDRQTVITDALGHSRTSAYDAMGNLISSTDALGRTNSYIYDNLNRQISKVNALGQAQKTTYDVVSNVTATTNELGQVTSYIYDAIGQQISVTDPLGHTRTSSYDLASNLISSRDALGQETRYTYDELNRRILIVDALGGTTRTNYDAVGHLVRIVDSVGNATSYAYDVLDRKTSETNQLGKTRTFSYDANGNLTQKVDRNGRVLAYAYDALNRQVSEQWLDGQGNSTRTLSYAYDAVGHLLTVNDPSSRYAYTYDAIDRIASIDNTGTVGSPAVKLSYSYDAEGNILTVSDAIGNTNTGLLTYAYDALNRATSISQTGAGVQSKQVTMTYNVLNQLTNLSRFRGANNVSETSYGYDSKQRLTQTEHRRGAVVLAGYGYTYDNADRITRIASSTDGATDYNYDSTNQLTGANHSSQTDEAYSYDANGNRTNSGYQTGSNNQMLSDGTYTYEYDNEGNRMRRVSIASGEATEYVWDYRNRLAQVVSKNANGSIVKSVGYTYDVNNQRIGKVIDGVTTERYIIDRNHISLVFNGSSALTHRYLYGTEVDQVLADETATGMVWALADHQGTIRDLVNGDGAIVSHIAYDSFGRVVSQTSSIDFRYGYTGREKDEETGLNYYRARYYDAAVGRFIGEDPISFDAGDTNLSRYVSNSSLNIIDPSGLYGEVISQTRSISFLNPERSRNMIGDPFGEYGSKLQAVKAELPGGGYIDRQDYYPVNGFHNRYPAVIFPIGRNPFGTKTRTGVIDKNAGIREDITRATIRHTNVNPGETNPAKPWGGKLEGDDSGHIIGRTLGGSNRADNIFAQTSKVNRGDYRNLFEAIKKKLDEIDKRCESAAKPTVDIVVMFNHSKTYPGLPLRPSSYSVNVGFSDETGAANISFSNDKNAVGGNLSIDHFYKLFQ